MNNTDQFGQTAATLEGVVYDIISTTSVECYVCGDYADSPYVCNSKLMWLCKKHYAEYLRGDTGWWELIKLTTEAIDKVE